MTIPKDALDDPPITRQLAVPAKPAPENNHSSVKWPGSAPDDLQSVEAEVVEDTHRPVVAEVAHHSEASH